MRIMSLPRLAALVLVALSIGPVLTACGKNASAGEPPKIVYGKDVCSRCGMIISEEKFASGIVARDGTSRPFDDPGEMIATIQEEGLGTNRAWVHDFDTTQWIDATKAFYAVSHDVVTSMGTGVVAFSSKAAAITFVASHPGEVMSWDDMLTKWKMMGGMH